MSTLFEISADMLKLMELLDDPEIDQQAIADTFEGLSGEFDLKVESWLKARENMKADIAARQRIAEDFMEKNRIEMRKVKRMEETLKGIMEATGRKKAGTAIFSATLCKAGGKLPLVWADGIKDDPKLLPEKYQITETIVKADTDKIREDLDAGIEVMGVMYGERSTYLRF